MAFFRKATLAEPYQSFVTALSSLLTQQAGQPLPLCRLNELAREQGLYTHAYFGTLGFSKDNKIPAGELLVAKDVSQLAKLTTEDWQTEFKTDTPQQKSSLSPWLTSKERYFTLYVAPTTFGAGKALAATVLPKTKVYQNHPSGEFVLETFGELLYCTYRLDLALHPQLEENHLPEERIAPPLTTTPLLDVLTEIAHQRLSDLDLQYLFTWLLQYSAAITATSSLYASYSQADLPAEVLEQTTSLVKNLVQEISQIPRQLENNATDSLQLSAQLLDQIPKLFEEAQSKMTALKAQLGQKNDNDSTNLD